MSKPRSRPGCYLFLFGLLLITGTPALAQIPENWGGPWQTPAGATVTNVLMDQLPKRRAQKRVPARHGNTKSAAPAISGGVATGEAAVQFRSTGTQLKTREIANLIDARNPQVFTIMTTILQEYEKGARAAGKPNDLALALSFFFATNASVYHDAGQPTDPQMLELRDVIADALIESNAFSGVTDRQKQEMYETLVLFTGFTLAVYQEGKAAMRKA